MCSDSQSPIEPTTVTGAVTYLATIRISSLVMMRPLKSFKPCCLKWSFCWILTPEGLWNFTAGLDNLIRWQRLDLESWVVSSSFPVSRLLLWMASNHFHFRDDLWFGLLLRPHQALCHMHGLTHNKSVPYLFSTTQSRSQQQTGIFIHLLKKLAPVNDISDVLYLDDPMCVFSLQIWEERQV